MKKIDRLLLQANNTYKKNTSGLYMAFVTKHEDKSWRAQVQLWNKANNKTYVLNSFHDTIREAIETINQLAAQYQNNEDILIFVEDF